MDKSFRSTSNAASNVASNMAKKKAQKQGHSAYDDKRLAAAMASFNLNYGRDETKLEKWQKLCDDCGIERGGSIKKCKSVSLVRPAQISHDTS